MKLLVTGASGLVGGAVVRAAARLGHEVAGIVGRYAGPLPGLGRRLSLDLADPATLGPAIDAIAPEAIINCAAVSEPAVCAQDPVRSAALNVEMPGLLARLATARRCRLVHISSEQVFDGAQAEPYRVADTPRPINLYGRQKLAAEERVLAAAPESAVIVRAPLLMGDSPGGRRGVHERLLNEWASGQVSRLYTDELRQPCTADNLAAALVELAGRGDILGLAHWAGTDLVSRYELGCRIRARFRLTDAEAPIVAATRAETPAVSSQRQASLGLDLRPLSHLLRTQPQSLDQQLAELQVPAPCREWYERTQSR